MKEIYLFSGLGADYRAFKHVDLPGYHLHFVTWIKPFKNERLEDYAFRITEQIHSERPILIGLSFGGIVAQEVAKILPVAITVLISSAKNKAALMPASNIFFKLKLYHFIPRSLLQHPNALIYNRFGITRAEDKEVLRDIIKDTDPDFLKWALDKITTWEQEEIRPDTISIHGTEDKIIPYSSGLTDYSLEGGGHFMILDRAVEINQIILRLLLRENS